MSTKKKLELTWIGKEERPRLEPRILIEQPEHSMPATDGSKDNILIHGDNLLALKALEATFSGKVQAAIIDPPYNTGSAFEHYDDGIEHSIWLSLMRERVEIIRNMISETGSFWVTLDDREAHYFKVMCDEIFGRRNFVADIAWQKKYAPGNNEQGISSVHDHLLCWAKNKEKWNWNLLSRSEKQDSLYKNPDNDGRGLWMSDNLTRAEFRERDFYPIKTPSGKDVWPATGRSWSRPPEEIERLRRDNRLWFGPKGDNGPRLKRFLSEVQKGIVARTIWLREEVGDNEQAKREAKALLGEDIFSTPKPERLIQRIIEISSRPGDIILDSFAGSGTTGAVAHKMNRRWIMVELGPHAHTHIVPRMKKVSGGQDPGGITETVDWKGGGGFRCYGLASSMLERDRWGNWIVSRGYNSAMLAEAMCRHMGFTYAPSQDPQEFWRHGHSTESDFIYVTTQALTHEVLASLSRDIGNDRHLLICCKAWSAKADAFPNLTLRKIPQAVLSNCEWGRDDYSFRLSNSPASGEPDEDGGAQGEVASDTKKRSRKPRGGAEAAPDDLFAAPMEG